MVLEMGTNEIDIYEDLHEGDLGSEIVTLQARNKQLENHISSLEDDIQKLFKNLTNMKHTQDNLTRNISELYKTAKNELARKDKMIADLRTKLDDMLFRRNEMNPAFDARNQKRLRDEPSAETLGLKKQRYENTPEIQSDRDSTNSRQDDRNFEKNREPVHDSHSYRERSLGFDNRDRPYFQRRMRENEIKRAGGLNRYEQNRRDFELNRRFSDRNDRRSDRPLNKHEDRRRNEEREPRSPRTSSFRKIINEKQDKGYKETNEHLERENRSTEKTLRDTIKKETEREKLTEKKEDDITYQRKEKRSVTPIMSEPEEGEITIEETAKKKIKVKLPICNSKTNQQKEFDVNQFVDDQKNIGKKKIKNRLNHKEDNQKLKEHAAKIVEDKNLPSEIDKQKLNDNKFKQPSQSSDSEMELEMENELSDNNKDISENKVVVDKPNKIKVKIEKNKKPKNIKKPRKSVTCDENIVKHTESVKILSQVVITPNRRKRVTRSSIAKTKEKSETEINKLDSSKENPQDSFEEENKQSEQEIMNQIKKKEVEKKIASLFDTPTKKIIQSNFYNDLKISPENSDSTLDSSYVTFGAEKEEDKVADFQIFKSNLPPPKKNKNEKLFSCRRTTSFQVPDSVNSTIVDESKKEMEPLKQVVANEVIGFGNTDDCNTISLELLNTELGSFNKDDFPNMVVQQESTSTPIIKDKFLEKSTPKHKTPVKRVVATVSDQFYHNMPSLMTPIKNTPVKNESKSSEALETPQSLKKDTAEKKEFKSKNETSEYLKTPRSSEKDVAKTVEVTEKDEKNESKGNESLTTATPPITTSASKKRRRCVISLV